MKYHGEKASQLLHRTPNLWVINLLGAISQRKSASYVTTTIFKRPITRNTAPSSNTDNSTRRKSQALVENTLNPRNANIPSDIEAQNVNHSNNVFGQYAEGLTLSTPYQPSYFTLDPSTNTKRGNEHFSPLGNAADDKRTRNDCHTEAEHIKLPLQQLISIILE